MIVYKGMREDMTCTQGRGKFQYHLGETIRRTGRKRQQQDSTVRKTRSWF